MREVGDFLDRHLIEGWRYKIKKLWTIRLTILFGLLTSLAGVWSALDGVIPPWVYVTVGFVMNFTLFVARMMRQRGVDE